MVVPLSFINVVFRVSFFSFSPYSGVASLSLLLVFFFFWRHSESDILQGGHRSERFNLPRSQTALFPADTFTMSFAALLNHLVVATHQVGIFVP